MNILWRITSTNLSYNYNAASVYNGDSRNYLNYNVLNKTFQKKNK